MIFNKTVSDVVASFNKMIDQLNEIEGKQESIILDIEDKKAELIEQQKKAYAEQENAVRIRNKIEQLVK